MFLFKTTKRKINEELMNFISLLSRLLFKISVITFIVYFSLEQFKVGLISNYFDLNILLIIAFLSSLLMIFFTQKNEEPDKKFILSYFIKAIFAIIIGVFIFQQLFSLGSSALLLSVLAVMAVYLILTVNQVNL